MEVDCQYGSRLLPKWRNQTTEVIFDLDFTVIFSGMTPAS
jgi:hypothetical protein